MWCVNGECLSSGPSPRTATSGDGGIVAEQMLGLNSRSGIPVRGCSRSMAAFTASWSRAKACWSARRRQRSGRRWRCATNDRAAAIVAIAGAFPRCRVACFSFVIGGSNADEGLSPSLAIFQRRRASPYALAQAPAGRRSGCRGRGSPTSQRPRSCSSGTQSGLYSAA